MSQLDLFAQSGRPVSPESGDRSKLGPQTDADFRRSKEYEKHIKSAQWRHTREALFKMRGKKCEVCEATADLEVHHLTYERFGRELMGDLKILCKPHHDEADRQREAEQRRAFDARCEATRDSNARHTYFTKKYGEGYFPDESMEREFDEWLERKREDDFWQGG